MLIRRISKITADRSNYGSGRLTIRSKEPNSTKMFVEFHVMSQIVKPRAKMCGSSMSHTLPIAEQRQQVPANLVAKDSDLIAPGPVAD